MTKKRITITISDKYLKDIDKRRGMVPRSPYIEHNLKKILRKK